LNRTNGTLSQLRQPLVCQPSCILLFHAMCLARCK
jgi:hypothetical protein